MIDVVYTMSNESRFNDRELRYSLRSLENFKDIGKVWIVGHKPHWLDPYKVNHIIASDPYKKNKDANLISKLILACTHPDLSGEFIWFSDDQLLLNEVSRKSFERPIIDNSHLIFKDRLNRWQTRLKRTVDALRDRQYKTNCYEAHVPYLIDKNKFPGVLFQYDYGEGVGYCGNTLYFNSIGANGIDGVGNLFVRLSSKAESVGGLSDICKGRLFLNYSDSAINDTLFSFLSQKFNRRSEFEMD